MANKSEDLLDLAGNDYLGLRQHPAVVAGAVAAAETYGGGAGASRLVTGTLPLHEELEQALAAFTGFPEALVFSTGYHANLSAVSALTDPDTLVVSDAHVHSSMIDACRLSRASVVVVPHNDVAAVDEALTSALDGREVATWSKPSGGYFVNLDVLDGTASRVVELAKGAGISLTPAGASYPHGKDPRDRNIRLAPSFPVLEEVETAMAGVATCVLLAAAEKLTGVQG